MPCRYGNDHGDAFELELVFKPEGRPGVSVTTSFCSAIEVCVFLTSVGLYAFCALADNCLVDENFAFTATFILASVSMGRLLLTAMMFVSVFLLSVRIDPDEGIVDKEKQA